MDLPQSNTQTPVYLYMRTQLLSLRSKKSLLNPSTVDRLKDVSIGYILPHRHRSSRGVKRNKQNVHPFIVASLNAQSVKGNDMACKRCEISTLFISAQSDKVNTFELVPSGFDKKSFPCQSRSRVSGIDTIYKSISGTNITFKTNFDFKHTSLKVVQASITIQHNTLHFFCLYRPPPNRRNNFTDYVY